MRKFNYESVIGVLHIDKIATNMDTGEAISDLKVLGEAATELAQTTGQAPVITKVKKLIANSKLREGIPIGCKVTLRKEGTYDFMGKLMNVLLLRIRGLCGVSATSLDSRGDYTLGVKEQLIFLEADYDKIDKVRGMDIVIVTTANTSEEAKALLKEMGMPPKK